jgi:hypothetical protein
VGLGGLRRRPSPLRRRRRLSRPLNHEPLRLLPNRNSPACRDIGPKPGGEADGRRLECRRIEWTPQDQLSTLPLLLDRTEAGAMADGRRATTDVAPPSSYPPWHTDEQMLEKRPEHCHFVPLFCAPWATFGRCGWLRKWLSRHEIGPEVWAAGRSPDRVA